MAFYYPYMSNPLISDEEFAAVVARCGSWRQVLRESGTKMTGTNSARRRATRLGLDVSHFRGARKWTDEQLREAVGRSSSWTELSEILECDARSAKRRAIRLGIPHGHLDRRAQASLRALPEGVNPEIARLRLAGESLSTAWFQLAGCVAAPVPGQAPYDLLVEFPGEGLKKVQVKTTRSTSSGDRRLTERPDFYLTVYTYVSASERAHLPYSDGEVDYFFLIHSLADMWLVPYERVCGQTSCSPGPEYEEFRIRWPA